MVILWLYGYYMVLRLRMLAMLASAAAVRCLHCGQLLLRRAPAGAQGRPPQQEQGRALGAEGDGGFDHQRHTLRWCWSDFYCEKRGNLKCIMKVKKKKRGTSRGFELATSNRNDLNKISTYLYRIWFYATHIPPDFIEDIFRRMDLIGFTE